MNPYQSLPSRSFWRVAVAEADLSEVGDLWTPKFGIDPDEPILTAGSCFARHIGRALLAHGMNFYDAEPAPPGLTAAERQARHFGEFSFRTGNIYTAALLRQWLEWAGGVSAPPEEAWRDGDRFFDPFRPGVDPDGHPDAAQMRAARAQTLAAIRRALAHAGCLIFTLGLTEAWRDRDTGAVYPMCPGTVRGEFDERRHAFCNFTFEETRRDLSAAIELARAANPELRVVLTVSPVPLTATATGAHALTATTYSKSVLRAVAGQLAAEHDHVDYFPAYEIVAGFPFRGAFFAPNLRSVTPDGVAFVMRHFFDAVGPGRRRARDEVGRAGAGPASTPDGTGDGGDIFCDDAVLDYYHAR